MNSRDFCWHLCRCYLCCCWRQICMIYDFFVCPSTVAIGNWINSDGHKSNAIDMCKCALVYASLVIFFCLLASPTLSVRRQAILAILIENNWYATVSSAIQHQNRNLFQLKTNVCRECHNQWQRDLWMLRRLWTIFSLPFISIFFVGCLLVIDYYLNWLYSSVSLFLSTAR